jgi:hypothetical protein
MTSTPSSTVTTISSTIFASATAFRHRLDQFLQGEEKDLHGMHK